MIKLFSLIIVINRNSHNEADAGRPTSGYAHCF